MEKYEYNIKLDQMKTLCAEENYEAAAEIADSINWIKIKNVNALVKAGEVYEKVQRYEDSKEILSLAYDRSPIGRMIIYRLAEVVIKMEDYESAEEYYKEFVEIAPHDNLRYVLRYHIRKGQKAPVAELIKILEDFKEQEYTEEWAYELAYLYHQAGLSEKCIDACDELILWFGDGPYVERSLELKMLYQPLTKVQEEKYCRFRQEREGKLYINPSEMERAGEFAHDTVAIPPIEINPNKYNTVNLQKEIAKGMQQIMDATEKSTVSDTIENIQKIVEDIPYLQIPREQEAIEDTPHIETDEEIDGSLNINFKEMLGEESDGQISLITNEQAMVERQITGQMTIAEILEEWEKTKRAAEAVLQEAEQRKLESAKARALQQAEDIMVRLNDVIPKLDAGVTPKELLEEEYLQGMNAKEEDVPVVKSIPETIIIPEAIAGMSELSPIEVVSAEELKPQEEIVEAEESAFEEVILEEDTLEEDVLEEDTLEEEAFEEDALEEVILEESEAVEALSEEIEEETVFEEETKRMPTQREMEEERLNRQITSHLPDVKIPENLNNTDKLPNVVAKEVKKLTEEQKAIFSYFIPVKGMEEQLCEALAGVAERVSKEGMVPAGNLIIQGGQGSGKTMLATSIIKVLQQQTGMVEGRVGKVDATVLNKKDISSLFEKVEGGCLIIERAGELTENAQLTLSLLLEKDRKGTFVVLEDSSKGIKKALAKNENFAKKFSETINVPIFTNDELVTFARSYSRELGYKIDDMAVLALYNRISKIQRLNQATTLTEVKEIVDEAIDREAHGGLRKAFSILTAKRYTDDDRIVLTEKDFE